jgi:hypothetical protein
MNFAEPARLRWSLFSSAIWTPVNKRPSLRVRMRLSVDVRRPTVWLNTCAPSPEAFVLDDPLAGFVNNEMDHPFKLSRFP